MDICTLRDDSVFEYVNSPHELEQSHVDCKQCLCGESAIIKDNVVAELGNALSGILHVQDVLSSSCISVSDENDVDKGKLCAELNLLPDNSSGVAIQEVLSKCATFPCSKKLPSSLLPIDGRDEFPDVASRGQCSLEPENPVCSRSISLPTPLKLVSAMKGSREKQGMPPKKLTLTWAPDVYDPPVLPPSHKMNSHCQQRSRTNKKNSKHKHKGKSSRVSNGNRKQYRKYIGKHELHSDSLAINDKLERREVGQSTVELADFAVIGPDSNCGRSFLRTSLSNVHISVAEAT